MGLVSRTNGCRRRRDVLSVVSAQVARHLTRSFAMTMLEPNWNQERPDSAAARLIWEQSVFTADADATPAVDELLKALRSTHVNGGATFGRFRFADIPSLHWFVSRNRFDE